MEQIESYLMSFRPPEDCNNVVSAVLHMSQINPLHIKIRKASNVLHPRTYVFLGGSFDVLNYHHPTRFYVRCKCV